MSDPAETQAGFVELFTELALQHLHPDSLPLQPAPPADLKQALERLAEAMAVMYAKSEG